MENGHCRDQTVEIVVERCHHRIPHRLDDSSLSFLDQRNHCIEMILHELESSSIADIVLELCRAGEVAKKQSHPCNFERHSGAENVLRKIAAEPGVLMTMRALAACSVQTTRSIFAWVSSSAGFSTISVPNGARLSE